MRSAVNDDNERMFGVGGQPERTGQKGLDFIPVIVADEAKGFDLSNLLTTEHLRVKLGQLFARRARVFDIELCEIRGAREAVSNRVALRHRPRPDAAAI